MLKPHALLGGQIASRRQAPTADRCQAAERTLLDVVVGEGTAILKLLSSEDQALLVGRDALLVLDLGLDIVDGVRGLHLEGDGFAREGLDEDLHRPARHTTPLAREQERSGVERRETLPTSHREGARGRRLQPLRPPN